MGSSSYITTTDGSVSQHIEYLPYGELFLEERNNKWNTPYKFNAKELDEETGLYYVSQRYHDPKINIWLSVDQLRAKYPNISSYAFCAGNPVKYVDPDGRDWFENTKTGEIYYNTKYYGGDIGKKDELKGEGWRWLGNNQMFMTKDRNGNIVNDDRSLVLNNGGKESLGGNPLNPQPISGELKLNSIDAEKFMANMGYERQPVQQTIWTLDPHVKIQGAPRSPNIEIRITEKLSYMKKGATETGLSELIPAWIVSTTSGTETISRYQINYSNNTSTIVYLKIFGLFYPENPSVIKSWSEYGNNIDLINKFKKIHGTK